MVYFNTRLVAHKRLFGALGTIQENLGAGRLAIKLEGTLQVLKAYPCDFSANSECLFRASATQSTNALRWVSLHVK